MPSHAALPGNAMPTAPLDTRYQIETPEGIDLPLRPAGLMPRALAFGFDLGLRGLILGILFIALAFLGDLGIGLGSILLFLVATPVLQRVFRVRGAKTGIDAPGTFTKTYGSGGEVPAA